MSGPLYPTVVTSKPVILDQQMFRVAQKIAEETLINFDTLTLERIVARELDGMVYELSMYVLTEMVAAETVTVTYSVPATWFQHLKATRMRDWIKRRWPVRYVTFEKTIRTERRNNYPRRTSALPREKFGDPVIFDQQHISDWKMH